LGRIKNAFSKMLEAQSLKSQIQTELLIRIFPFMIAYTVFFYFWVFLDWGFLEAVTPSSIIFSIGTVLYVTYAQSIREECVSLGSGPINMTLRWGPTSPTGESNVILQHVTLLEEDRTSKAKLLELRKRVKKRTTEMVKPKQTDKVFKVFVSRTKRFYGGIVFLFLGIMVLGTVGLILAYDVMYWGKPFEVAFFDERPIGEQKDLLSWLVSLTGYQGRQIGPVVPSMADLSIPGVCLTVFGFLLMLTGKSRTSVKAEELSPENRPKDLWAEIPLKRENPGQEEALKEEEEPIQGKYFTLCWFHRPMISPLYGETNPFSMIAFIHDAVFDKTFRRSPGQLVSYKTQAFETSAPVIDATFCFWDEELEPCPIFRVTSDSELTRLIQMGLNIKPSSSKWDVEKASKLRSGHQALVYAMRLRNVLSVLRGTVEGSRDAQEEGVATIDRLLDNREKIRKTQGPLGLSKKKIILYIVLGALAMLFVSWVMGWI